MQGLSSGRATLALIGMMGLELCGSAGTMGARAAETDWGPAETGLPEILVTARKRSQAIDTVPATISVVGEAALQSTATHDLTELAGQVSGMVFSRAPDDGLALTLRGIGTPARSQAFDQSIALFLDGTYLAKGRLYPIALLDVERVEVLRGPHSSEVGKNASVGAISVVSRQPGTADGAEASSAYDLQRGGLLFTAAADLQTGSDSALRIAANSLDRHGWVHNGATGDDVPEDRDDGARLTYRSQFTNALSGVFRYQFSEHEHLGTAMQLVGPPGSVPAGQGDSTLNDQSFAFTPRGPNGESHHETRAQIGSAHLQLAAGGLQWVSETAWVGFHASHLDDLDFGPSADVDFLRIERFRQFSQEFRMVSPAGQRVEYMAGIAYLRNYWESHDHQYWNTPHFPPTGPLAGQLFNGPFTNDFTQDTISKAAFTNGSVQVRDALRLSAGLRYTDEAKHVRFGRQNAPPFTAWNSAIGFNPPFPVTPLRFDGSFVDANGTLEYDVAKNALLYVAYGRGNKLGGFVETNGVPHANPAVEARIDSETTTSYEGGVKVRALEDRIAISAALFDMHVANFQDTTFNGTAFVTTNLPVRSSGVELDLRWQVSAGWTASVSATWDDAQELVAGRERQLTQAPRWTALASADYQHAVNDWLTWRIGADVHYRSVMFNQRGELFSSSTFTPLGVRVAVEEMHQHWGVMLVGRNITNQISAEFAGPTPDPTAPPSALPEPLRSVLLTAWVRR